MNGTPAEEASTSIPVDAARTAIDQIDRRIVGLLAERMQAVVAIGAAKAGVGPAHTAAPRAVFDADRQRQVAAQWRDEAQRLGLPQHFVQNVLREVLHHSHREQQRHGRGAPPTARVGYQGEAGCYGDEAIERLFHARAAPAERVPYRTFRGLVDALEAGAVDFALLPLENSICGAVPEVVQLLTERPLHLVDEEFVHVDHCLAAPPGATLAGLRSVQSHPVALLQCQRFLSSLPHVAVQSSYDTAGAAAEVAAAGDAGAAAICSLAAADRHGLQVLQAHVADHEHNQTRFVLLKRTAEPLPADDTPCRTSLCFELQHRHGELLRCLERLARHDVNLTRIESRPIADRPWQYAFLVDLEGHSGEARIAAAVNELRRCTGHLRVLGSYPDRSVVREALPRVQLPERTRGPALAPPAATCAMPNATSGTPLACLTEPGQRTVVHVGDVAIGGGGFTLIAGPCAVESQQQVMAAAAMVRRHGATILRGGVFKPRTSPYAFQGLGLDGLDLLTAAGRSQAMPVVTEVLRVEDVEAVAERADMLQIGARNMQNTALLQAIGRVRRPVLLKRGMSATIEELLLAAEYILREGNQRVVLCERGIRTFERATRSTLDISAVPVLRQRTHLPILVDPSHAAGRRDLVVPLALAAVAAGADGLIVEAHPCPDEALCDKEQALTDALLGELAHGAAGLLQARGVAWP